MFGLRNSAVGLLGISLVFVGGAFAYYLATPTSPSTPSTSFPQQVLGESIKLVSSPTKLTHLSGLETPSVKSPSSVSSVAKSSATSTVSSTISSSTPKSTPAGLLGEYYKYTSDGTQPPADPFMTKVGNRLDPQIDFTWQTYDWTVEPLTGTGTDYFAIKWTGYLSAPQTGTYTLAIYGDDGLKLYLDDQLVIDCWNWCGDIHRTELTLTAGQSYAIRLEQWQGAGAMHAHLLWKLPEVAEEQTIPTQYLSATKK
jgi:beta-glucosidase